MSQQDINDCCEAVELFGEDALEEYAKSITPQPGDYDHLLQVLIAHTEDPGEDEEEY